MASFDLFLDFDNAKELNRHINRAVALVFRYWDGRIETAMKVNAPWTDRTTNARNGLSARYERVGVTHRIVLSHGVPYGIYLETMKNGEHSIIMPTVRAYGPRVMQALVGVLEHTGGPGGGGAGI